MKNLRRRLQKLSPRLIFALALFMLFGCALLNGRTGFDLLWITVTGGGTLLLTLLIVAPRLLPIANTWVEYKGSYRIFVNYLVGRISNSRVIPMTAGLLVSILGVVLLLSGRINSDDFFLSGLLGLSGLLIGYLFRLSGRRFGLVLGGLLLLGLLFGSAAFILSLSGLGLLLFGRLLAYVLIRRLRERALNGRLASGLLGLSGLLLGLGLLSHIGPLLGLGALAWGDLLRKLVDLPLLGQIPIDGRLGLLFIGLIILGFLGFLLIGLLVKICGWLLSGLGQLMGFCFGLLLSYLLNHSSLIGLGALFFGRLLSRALTVLRLGWLAGLFFGVPLVLLSIVAGYLFGLPLGYVSLSGLILFLGLLAVGLLGLCGLACLVVLFISLPLLFILGFSGLLSLSGSLLDRLLSGLIGLGKLVDIAVLGIGGLLFAISCLLFTGSLIGGPIGRIFLGLSGVLGGFVAGYLLARLVSGLFGGLPPLTLVREGKIVTTTPTTDGLVPSGVIVTDSTSVVVLRTATGISRIVGPGTERDQSPSGVIFTEWNEEIDTIIDLRPQVRFMAQPGFPATTNDGMSVDARIITFFSLKRVKSRRIRDLAKEPMRWPPPFIWHTYPIWQALNARRMLNKDNTSQRTGWTDIAMAIAIPQLRQIIARYTLDYLTAPLGQPKHPRFAIRDELVSFVKQRLEVGDPFSPPTGIDMRFMAVPLMWPSTDVQRQRIESWKNEWRRRTDEIEGRAEAEAIRTREMARAQVQGEMTARINDALKEAKASGTGNHDLITLRFLEAMEKMAKDPTTRALLTLDSLKILQQLRQMLAPEQPGGKP